MNSANTDRFLSQDIADIQASKQTLAEYPYSFLDMNFAVLAWMTANEIAVLIPYLQSMQTDVLSFTDLAFDKLNNQLAILNKETDVELNNFVGFMESHVKPIQATVRNVFTLSTEERVKLLETCKSLQEMQEQHRKTIAGLQSNLDAEYKKLDSLNNKKWYLRLLDFWFDPIVEELIEEITISQTQIKNLESQIRSTQSQINNQEALISQIENTIQSCVDTINKVSCLGNSIDTLLADLDSIAEDIKKADSSKLVEVKLFIHAADVQVKSLRQEAS